MCAPSLLPNCNQAVPAPIRLCQRPGAIRLVDAGLGRRRRAVAAVAPRVPRLRAVARPPLRLRWAEPDRFGPPSLQRWASDSFRAVLTLVHRRALNAGYLNDLHVLEPAAAAPKWTRLAAAVGDPPTPRYALGFVAVSGALFVFGGFSETGDRGKNRDICYYMRTISSLGYCITSCLSGQRRIEKQRLQGTDLVVALRAVSDRAAERPASL